MFNSPSSRFINGLGTGAPAMIPVRRFDESKSSGFGTLRIDSNIVGTPCKAVHFSSEIARSTACGSNVSPGKMIFDPWVTTASIPRTSPKQWNNGGGQHRMSNEVRFIRSPMKRELLTRLLLEVSSCYYRHHTEVYSSLVCQHGGFGIARRTAGELQIAHIPRMQTVLAILQKVTWN